MNRGTKLGETGRKAESRTAKRLGGELTPASGAMDGAKGDFRLPGFVGENKSTTVVSFVVHYAQLQKISQEARAVGLWPMLCFQFTRKDGEPRSSGRWVCIPEHVWKELTDGAAEIS